MKRLVYVVDGAVRIETLAPGARMVFGEVLADREVKFEKPMRLWQALGPKPSPVERTFVGETEDAFFARVAARVVPQNAEVLDEVGSRYRILDLPDDKLQDRYFRSAFKLGSNGIEIDMPKARAVHRAHLRKMRAPLFRSLDEDYLRADEAGDQAEKVRIAKQKQALRDVTADPAIDAAQTPEELRAVIPVALKQ
jgi:hypothetical protein